MREDATKESDFTLDDEIDDDDEENDWDGEVEWNEEEVEGALEGDVPDESAAYLEFLNKEAQKFGSFADDDDDEMDEESLLETPLDKVEPYGMFKHVFLSKSPLPSIEEIPSNIPSRPPARTAPALRQPDQGPRSRGTADHRVRLPRSRCQGLGGRRQCGGCRCSRHSDKRQPIDQFDTASH